MTVDPTTTSAPSAGLIDRVKNILLTPKAEWARIAAETPNTNSIFIGYALPLLAVGAVCGLIGSSFIGVPFLGRLPIAWTATQAVFSVVIGLVSLFICSIIANALAPTFGSRQDTGRAQQLVVYGRASNDR